MFITLWIDDWREAMSDSCNHLGFVYYDLDENWWYCQRCSETDIDEPEGWTAEEVYEAKGLTL